MAWEEFTAKVIEVILPPVVTVVVSLIGLAFLRLSQWVKAHTKIADSNAIFQYVETAVNEVVLEMFQTVVTDLKKARDEDSPGGKHLTDEEKRSILSDALNRVLLHLSFEKKTALRLALGLRDDDVDDDRLRAWLVTKIESAIFVFKARFEQKKG